MDKILVLDFGGQYDQLIARRIREMNVYAEIKTYREIDVAGILEEGYKGIVFTGGPNSVYEKTSPHFDPQITKLRRKGRVPLAMSRMSLCLFVKGQKKQKVPEEMILQTL